MKAVILAAGRGKRLKPITNELPKAFIPIGDSPILHYSLQNISAVGITNVIIVVGFMEEYFKRKLGHAFHNLEITYVSNREYLTTGSMYSLSKAEEIIDEDILLLESDLLYAPKALEVVLTSHFQDMMLVAEVSGSGDEVFICADDLGRITDLGKNIPDAKKRCPTGEIVGISKFSTGFLDKLFEKAKEDYRQGKIDYHYEEVVFKTSELRYPVYALFCKDLAWVEIDTEKDLKRAKEIIYPRIKKAK
jgi:choline kinase